MGISIANIISIVLVKPLLITTRKIIKAAENRKT